jgi:cytochrome c oxidase subunit I
MSTASLRDGLRTLPAGDRALLKLMIGCALVALGVGVVFGLWTALARAGIANVEVETGYRAMTAHGVSVFFYWLYFGLAAVLLALTAVTAGPIGRIAWGPVAWIGCLSMIVGFLANQFGTWTGTPLLYDGSPEIAVEAPFAAGIFFLGYLLLALGLFLIACSAIATAIAGKAAATEKAWSPITFGAVAFAGFIMVSATATMNAFLGECLWGFGFAAMPTDHATAWHLLFHNMHYLPLMGTVLIWYALVREMTGVGSIFGDRFSKIIFTLYLVFVPPTSLYHMFLEPDLSPLVRALGSVLSLFISVPTTAVFLVIVASLEAHARACGARGLFGWLRMLPWRKPEMSAIGMAVVNLAFGGTLAFVLIQEKLAGLLSDTFFVPGYFHFLTIGTVSLTLLAALARMIPALTGRPLWAPRTVLALPYLVTAGIAVFGAAGTAAGLMGMPRRVLDSAYDGAAPTIWALASSAIGLGAVVMAIGLLAYVVALGRSLMRASTETVSLSVEPGTLVAPGGLVAQQPAWTGPISVLILVAAMYGMTIVAFTLMRALPIVISGGGGH